MRTLLLCAALAAAGSAAQAQSPADRLQAQTGSSAEQSTSPNAGNDDVMARRKLEDSGYKDIRGLTPNGDGTMSGQATRDDPRGSTRAPRPDVKVDIDASGRIRER
jgi:hypothetical protein